MKRIAVVIMTLSCVAVLAASCQPKVFEGNPAPIATSIPPAPGYAATLPEFQATNRAPLVLHSPGPRSANSLIKGCRGMLVYQDDHYPYMELEDGSTVDLDPKYGALAPFEPGIHGETKRSPVFVTDGFGSPCEVDPYVPVQAIGLEPGLSPEQQRLFTLPAIDDLGPPLTTGLVRHIDGNIWIVFDFEGGGARTAAVTDPGWLVAKFSFSDKYGNGPDHPRVHVEGKVGADGILCVTAVSWAFSNDPQTLYSSACP